MILIDSRVGSKDLIKPLGKGIAKLTTLEFADLCFVGMGPGEKPVFVGIEIKTVNDALNCVIDGRFAGHQLPGLVKEYDIVYLLIQGVYRASKEGILEVPYGRTWREVRLGSRRFMWRDFINWQTTMETMGGVRLRHARTRKDTAAVILALYKWWSSKNWEDHKAHLAPNKAGSSVLGIKYSLKRRIAAQLPGVGDELSGRVADYFPTIESMVVSCTDDWKAIEGIGKDKAMKIVQELIK